MKQNKNKMLRNTRRRKTGRKSTSLVAEIQAEIGRRLKAGTLLGFDSSMVPPRPKRPMGPRAGAEYTTTQLIEAFTDEIGLTNGYQIFASAGSALLGAIAVEFGDLPQVSSFSTLFDQYRVDKLRFILTPVSNVHDATSTATPNQVVPRLLVVIDRDDASAPASLAALREYDNCVEVLGTAGVEADFEPAVTPAVFSSGAFTGYEISPSGDHWIDVASPNVPFYGIKFGVDSLSISSTQLWVWDVRCYATFSFKNTR